MLCWLYLNDDDTTVEVEVVNAFRFSFISNNETANEVVVVSAQRWVATVEMATRRP